jgi:hypothetical protein
MSQVQKLVLLALPVIVILCLINAFRLQKTVVWVDLRCSVRGRYP